MTEDRAEAALAEAAVYRPGFKSNSVSEEQIHKLQQLRQRRLQIQRAQPPLPSPKPKNKKRKQEEDGDDAGGASSNSDVVNKGEEEFAEHSGLKKAAGPRKRQKLHWGLDVKQRWERKGNM